LPINTLTKLKGFFFSIAKKINLHGAMRTIFYDKWYMQALKLENILETQGWVFLSSGKDRRVWRRGNVVLKIAYVESGILSNKRERYLYINGRNHYAPCRLVKENVLMMRAVTPMDESFDEDLYEMIPEWANQLNDGPQVGMDKNGKILIYDYAEENPRMIHGGNHCAPSSNGGKPDSIGGVA